VYTPHLRVHRKRPGRPKPRRFAPRRGGDFLLVGLAVDILVRYVPFHGLHAVASYVPSVVRGVPIVVWSRPERSMKRPQSKAAEPGAGPLHVAPIETNVLGGFANLISHLVELRYEDGTPRRTGWVLIKTLGPSWVTEVKEPTAGVRMTVTGPTIDDMLALVDLVLGADEPPWEVDPWAKPQNSKKSK